MLFFLFQNDQKARTDGLRNMLSAFGRPK